MGIASGCAAFIASASVHVSGWRKSISSPCKARLGGVLAQNGSLDQPVGPVGRVEDLVVVLDGKRREVDDEVMLVGHRQADLRDLRVRIEHGLAPLVER